MAKIEIVIEGKAYPCRQTMGAMLRFKKETGKEVTNITTDLSDMCAYLYCCTASACKHDGIKFDYSLMDFADSLTPDDINVWAQTISAVGESATEGDGEKKS